MPAAARTNTSCAIPGDRVSMLLRVAWMSIALGLAMQFASMAAIQMAGGPGAQLGIFLRDLAQKVSWSTLVCVGVAVGSAVSQARPAWVGISGLLAAPLAFVVARIVQKSTAGAVNATPPDEIGMNVFMLVVILRALEYGALGLVLGHLARRPDMTVARYTLTGLLAGLLFGSAVVATLYANANPTMPTPRLVSTALNELLFPVGCALVLFAANTLGERFRAAAG